MQYQNTYEFIIANYQYYFKFYVANYDSFVQITDWFELFKPIVKENEIFDLDKDNYNF